MIIDSRFGDPIDGRLSVSEDKRRLYGLDTYFVEGWEDLTSGHGDAADALVGYGSITLKPDAFASGVSGRVLDWLDAEGFLVVAARRIRFDRHSIRAMWAYQWNVATRDRKDVVDALLTAGDSVFLVVHRPEPGDEPTATRLSRLKGPADPRRRRPGQLRAELGCLNTLFNYVHTADEPADLVRELGLLFESSERYRIAGEMWAPVHGRGEVRDLVDAVQDATSVHALGLAAVVDDVRPRILRADDGARAAAQILLDDLVGGRTNDWRFALAVLTSAGADLSQWEQLAVMTHLVDMDLVDGEVLLRGVSSPGGQEHPVDTSSDDRGSGLPV